MYADCRLDAAKRGVVCSSSIGYLLPSVSSLRQFLQTGVDILNPIKKILIVVIPLLVAVAAVAGILITRGGVNTTVPTTTFAPVKAADFELKLFSGKTIRLTDLKDKTPVVINFWASWCGRCREEAPTLAKVSKTFSNRIKFLGIVINDSQANAEAFMKQFDITYDNGLDTSKIGDAYGITGIPETFWIDKNGQVVDHWIGAIDEANLVQRTNNLVQ